MPSRRGRPEPIAPNDDTRAGSGPAHEAGAGSRRLRPPDGLYGRAKGHPLSPRQRAVLDAEYPALRLPFEEPAPADVCSLFPVPVEDVWLEVGFGGGEHLLAQATAHPGVGLIGCEPFENGVAKAVAAIADTGIRNVRLHRGDARDVLAWLPEASLGRLFLLYPDPWPKLRHHKRRFVSAATLDLVARVLRPGADLRFASDIEHYVGWTKRVVDAHPAFALRTEPADERRPWPDWPGTRYEQKALAAGRHPTYLTIRRL